MKQRHAGCVIALATLSLTLAAPLPVLSYDYTYARVVRLSLVDGDVQIARPDEQNWEQAVVNLPIQQGYTLATGQGRAEVEFESGATARLAENSILQFTELALADGARLTKLTLTQGTATFYANLAREDSFVVTTPHVQVNIAENSRFRVDVYNDGSSVNVLKGDVEVDSPAGTSRLTKGHTLAFRSSEPDQIAVERSPKADAWDRWVADRDEVVSTASNATLRYAADTQYRYGLADLYSFGNWYNVSGYGQCWQPYGVGFNWAPFWNGRWAFYPGLGWTWLSFEPWGWLPYHFGRWAFTPAFGWVWVPGFSNPWQPAPVHWVRVGNRIGWFPRGPHDRPGQSPTNLPHGVVLNTPTGVVGGAPNLRADLSPHDRPEVLDGPPFRLNDAVSRGRPGTNAGGATSPAGFSGAVSSAPPVAAPPGVRADVPARGGAPAPSSIVYDPRERRYVNNPAAPTPAQAPQGFSGTATPAPPAAVRPPLRRELSPDIPAPRRPAILVGRDADAGGTSRGMSRTPQRPEAPPAAMRPNVAPPRMEIHRPASPPSRPASPAMRVESPRSTPRMESASPRPASPPRSEPHPQAPSRPH